MAIRAAAAMISSLLLALQVFSAFQMYDSAADQNSDPPDCRCSHPPCIGKENRKYLAERILSFWSSREKKPRYHCWVESYARDVYWDPKEYEKIKGDFEKLEKIGRGNKRYQTPEMLKPFLNETVEFWRSNISGITGKTRFGCTLFLGTTENKVICLFTW